ncbi:acyl-CoA dehydrogenase [Nocardioides dubius]|uniref:acyl-CoA dehydrogenase family protein n=1 Tax=Nocardioides dubius TaxID=317019 RepID=UPI0039EC884F
MPIALTADHRDLADVVAQLVARSADREVWPELVAAGLLGVHLPEESGGAGAGLMELAVIAESTAAGLLPGRWLPSVLASYALARLAPQHPALAELADGASGALVLGGLVAEAGDGTVRLSGVSAPVLGLPGADHALVRAEGAEGAEWFLISGGALAAGVREEDGIDLTRPIGRLDGGALAPGSAQRVAAGECAEIELAVAALFAAEAAGLCGWAVRTGVEYAKTRVQFDRPIGSFQAIQHKAALMLVRSEVAATAAWDAARAEQQSPAQQRLAAAQATLNATHPAVEVALELVTLLGGIGFTWEHDAHRYWRRALSLSALAGTEAETAAWLGALALTEQRDFSFLDPEALPELRAEVGAVLDRVQALGIPATTSASRVTGEPDNDEAEASWQRVRPGAATDLLADAGLIAPHYPEPYGRGAGVQEQAVIADEFAKRGLRQPSTVIGEWALPTLLEHGTTEQQKRFVTPTLRGEIFWCQLFSEPGAGSDLASLRTKATKVEGGWRLQGQKVWTSGAHEAQWGICLARSDASAAKHRGISYFLVDLASPGVEVRPLKQATGRHEFNEVFLDDVFVPDECLVGEAGHGWRLAATTLANERLQMGGRLTHGGAHRLRAVIESSDHAASTDVALAALGRCTARENALSALNLRAILARLGGMEIGAEISVAKVFNASAQRAGTFDLLAVIGPAGALTAGGHAIDHLGLPAVLFGGGTTEIQLNVIAQRVLGLPREGR